MTSTFDMSQHTQIHRTFAELTQVLHGALSMGERQSCCAFPDNRELRDAQQSGTDHAER